MGTLTPSTEQYLRAIYQFSRCGQTGVRLVTIATYLNVTKTGASQAVDSLEEKGYVTKNSRKEIFFTETGRQAAQELFEKHELIFLFLREVMEFNNIQASTFACELEHVIDDETVQKLKSYFPRASTAS